MRIYTRRAFGFTPPAGSDEKPVVTRAMDFAVVPDWVAKTKLFDLGVQDENITVVENASQAADAEIAAREAQPKPPRSVVGSRSSATAGE